MHYLGHVENLEADSKPHNFYEKENLPKALFLSVNEKSDRENGDEIINKRSLKIPLSYFLQVSYRRLLALWSILCHKIETHLDEKDPFKDAIH